MLIFNDTGVEMCKHFWWNNFWQMGWLWWTNLRVHMHSILQFYPVEVCERLCSRNICGWHCKPLCKNNQSNPWCSRMSVHGQNWTIRLMWLGPPSVPMLWWSKVSFDSRNDLQNCVFPFWVPCNKFLKRKQGFLETLYINYCLKTVSSTDNWKCVIPIVCVKTGKGM